MRKFDFSKKKREGRANWVEDKIEDEEIVTGLECRNEQKRMMPIEDLEEICLDLANTTKTVRIVEELDNKLKGQLIHFIQYIKDVFASTHSDMVGIDSIIMCHALNIDPNVIAI